MREWWRSHRKRREGRPRCIEGQEEGSLQLKWNWQEGNDLKEREMIPREESKENTEGKSPSEYGGKSQGRRGIENPNRGTTYPVQQHSTQHKTFHTSVLQGLMPFLRRHPNPMKLTSPFIPIIPSLSSAADGPTHSGLSLHP